MITLELPIPPSVNSLYHNNSALRGGGRSKTKRAKLWEKKARGIVAPVLQCYNDMCRANIQERARCYNIKSKSHNLQMLHERNMGLIYSVVYTYAFAKPRHVRPCDILNFEKLLSDFLVDCGLMLDDSFIEQAEIKRTKADPKNPHVTIELNSLDNTTESA